MIDFGFLLDEHVSFALRALLQRHEPGLIIYPIGDPEAPPKGTPDFELLRWIAVNNCLLITDNRASMPRHLADHLVAGSICQGSSSCREKQPGR